MNSESTSDDWNVHSDHTEMSPVSNPPSANPVGIEAVAARIQERAIQLYAEQTKLKGAQYQLEAVLRREKEEAASNHSIRRRLLEATNSRNGVELEKYNARDKISNYLLAIRQMEDVVGALGNSKGKVARQWRDDLEHLYSRHHLDSEYYTKSWKCALEAKTSLQAERRERKAAAESRLFATKHSENRLRTQTSSLQAETISLEHDGEVAGEVSCLAAKVQEALARRTELRRELKIAQKDLVLANRDMLVWEARRSALSSGTS